MFATITRPRCGGKTHKLMELARKNPDAIIIVHSEEAARHLILHDIAKNRIFTFAQVENGTLRGLQLEQKLILIDNVEYLLSRLLNMHGVLDSGIIVTATGINL
jgi:hypothetical protein